MTASSVLVQELAEELNLGPIPYILGAGRMPNWKQHKPRLQSWIRCALHATVDSNDSGFDDRFCSVILKSCPWMLVHVPNRVTPRDR